MTGNRHPLTFDVSVNSMAATLTNKDEPYAFYSPDNVSRTHPGKFITHTVTSREVKLIDSMIGIVSPFCNLSSI